MKWFIVNQQDSIARLYWSNKTGSWGAKSAATSFARQHPEVPLPLCFLGARWIREFAT